MAINISQDYSQFYMGTEQLKSYGSNSAAKKDTLVKYQFNIEIPYELVCGRSKERLFDG